VSVTPIREFAEGFVVDFPVADLHESPENPRYITDEALARLRYAIVQDPKMLEARPVICDRYGETVCGNMRLRAAEQLGYVHIPTYVCHFASDAEKREWMLRDNQSYGDYVPDLVAQMVFAHKQEGADLQMLGFSDDEVTAAILRATGEAIVVPEPSESPKQELVSEVMIEIRCDRAALAEIQATLEGWMESIEALSVAVSQ
jgi:ParB-like chromosome segregation protein Spo0J